MNQTVMMNQNVIIFSVFSTSCNVRISDRVTLESESFSFPIRQSPLPARTSLIQCLTGLLSLMGLLALLRGVGAVCRIVHRRESDLFAWKHHSVRPGRGSRPWRLDVEAENRDGNGLVVTIYSLLHATLFGKKKEDGEDLIA